MLAQQNNLPKLLKSASFRIILPAYTQIQPQDISKIKTRNWLVPGEKTIIFIEVKNCVGSMDAFLFYCTIVDLQKTPNPPEPANYVPVGGLIPNYTLPNIQSFKTPDGILYFPIRLTVPLTCAQNVSLDAFCLRETEPVSKLKCFSFSPFKIYKTLNFTPQSMVVSINVNVNFPQQWTDSVSILSAALKFNEKIVSETDFSQKIAIISTADTSLQIYDGDIVTCVFALKPLNDLGGSAMANLPLVFNLTWRADGSDYVSSFQFQSGTQPSDLVITAPSVKADLLKNSRMPITISSVGAALPRSVTLNFGSGNIQPMTRSIKLDFTSESTVKIIDYNFIPLVSGHHELDISAECDGKILRPLFPIFVEVSKHE
ncbi:hypothetical protein TVAG_194860 [Trichomonas vaginalis G3]|uniref:Uncharacterized protein n=1 Tax=Trichomonas vaginalis (strain ATCC PRA-98 / G3) TaxID=412133 RepID=A2FL29_TRIV3|nr:hypothetical protein TVAGG3_1047560 [Trichomonas vaginalis G3]EAX94400.1 hypothetical protein TVAG_194860 [Trichomonas vaginalis G3]KAI5493986.1 hypothetical protein TVAGG3_1047560 [Trichomonas vaginalis G3]|eukprot:XP_001307330.1 hypothetical protein [Trichomonas vaginalis G3]